MRFSYFINNMDKLQFGNWEVSLKAWNGAWNEIISAVKNGESWECLSEGQRNRSTQNASRMHNAHITYISYPAIITITTEAFHFLSVQHGSLLWSFISTPFKLQLICSVWCIKRPFFVRILWLGQRNNVSRALSLWVLFDKNSDYCLIFKL